MHIHIQYKTYHPPHSSHTGSACLKHMGLTSSSQLFWLRSEKENRGGLQWVNINMNLIWSLCLICVAWGLRAARAGPVGNTNKKNNAAPQEDVNVLMFGVIQFSDSLKYISETTEAKIDRISQTLKKHEGRLQRLGTHAEKTAEIKKQIKADIMLLQVSKSRNM